MRLADSKQNKRWDVREVRLASPSVLIPMGSRREHSAKLAGPNAMDLLFRGHAHRPDPKA
jgi:hypothetical protein